MQPGDHLTSILGENFAIGALASHVGMPAKYRAIVSMAVSERVVPLVAPYLGYRPKTSNHCMVRSRPIQLQNSKVRKSTRNAEATNAPPTLMDVSTTAAVF